MMKCDYVKNVGEQQKSKFGLRYKSSPTKNSTWFGAFSFTRRVNLIFPRIMLELSQFRGGG
jgi:hypothetical protein